ncbi:hypothetical protein NPIL_656501 [Nephila pilipes]|uniref:Uncharacterized protein n=1 Tax=Nephila pilipes TaxID=299642 RepID=A0A8X6U8Z3_NEPPI|nr:hypothetical protein NPIL_400441 [Nephila pilipes]GFU24519.1 hypothetical protein NPIL_656501 [Nephila pilipes]
MVLDLLDFFWYFGRGDVGRGLLGNGTVLSRGSRARKDVFGSTGMPDQLLQMMITVAEFDTLKNHPGGRINPVRISQVPDIPCPINQKCSELSKGATPLAECREENSLTTAACSTGSKTSARQRRQNSGKKRSTRSKEPRAATVSKTTGSKAAAAGRQDRTSVANRIDQKCSELSKGATPSECREENSPTTAGEHSSRQQDVSGDRTPARRGAQGATSSDRQQDDEQQIVKNEFTI